MILVSIRLSQRLLTRLDRLAMDHGGRAKLLHAIVVQYLWTQRRRYPPRAPRPAPAKPSKAPELRLDDQDLVRLDEECAKLGMTRAQWIEALIRRRLHGSRQLNPRDRARLSKLNIQMRILREKAQLALASAQRQVRGGSDAERIIAQMAQLEVAVRQVGQAVRAGFEGSDEYWDANMDVAGPRRRAPIGERRGPDGPSLDAQNAS